MYRRLYSSHTSHHPSQTPRLPWISYATQKLMLDSCKMLEKLCEAFHTFLWQNFIAYRSSKVSACIFEIHQLRQLGFSRVYSNCCCSCSFEREIIKIGLSSHKMYRNSEFSRVYDNFKCLYKKNVETYRMHLVCLFPWPFGYDYANAYPQSSWEDVTLEVTISSVRVRM